MAPLPTPGGDNNVWGTILNNYLLVAHQADGTQNAEDVVNIPTAPITSTNVQDAIDELAGITATPGFYPTRTEAADYSATDNDQVILVDATATTRTVFLPTPVGREGKVFTIRKVDTSNNDVRVNVAAGGIIDNITPSLNRYTLRIRYETLTIVSDGTNWHRLDQWSKNIAGFNSANRQSARVWVSADYGNDEYSGVQPWAAKRTITAALAVGGVNEIIIDEGTYTETLTLSGGTSLRGAIGSLVIIQAPSNAATAVNMGNNCQLHNLSLRGTGAAYTGTLLKFDQTGFCMVKNVSIGNVDGTITSPRSSGFWDPVTGGTGIEINFSEKNYFENVAVGNVRNGILFTDTHGGGGTSQQHFNMLVFTDCWNEFSTASVGGGHVFENVKSQNPQGNADSTYAWDFGADYGGMVFIGCDTSESAANRRSRISGDSNTFINCSNAPSTKFYIEGNKNRFINHYSLNTIFLDGDENVIDGFDVASSGNVVINGNRNRIRGIFRPDENASNQISITDNGIGTERDYNTRSTGPPPGGYGWYVGDFIRNTAFATGQPEGWFCTTQALGPAETQGGTWIEVPSGNATAITGKFTVPITATTWTAVGAIT